MRAFKREGEGVGFVGVEGWEGLKDVLVGCDGLETFVRFLLSFESNPEGFDLFLLLTRLIPSSLRARFSSWFIQAEVEIEMSEEGEVRRWVEVSLSLPCHPALELRRRDPRER